MKTFSAKPHLVNHHWYLVDAKDMVLGRLASRIAHYLRGKHKPEFTPHVDTGDYMVIVNADQIRVTGRKQTDKVYYRHTGYPGGLKSTTFEKLMEKNPILALEKAVKGMLPKNSLGRAMFRKLKVYSGETHLHEAQQPQLIKLVDDKRHGK